MPNRKRVRARTCKPEGRWAFSSWGVLYNENWGDLHQLSHAAAKDEEGFKD
ncbi:MAG: hypothetical protein ACI8W8_001900 [Rhodothermales bacterium]|jgi:hypothetical protein